MRTRHLLVGVVAVFSLVFSISAQKQQPNPPAQKQQPPPASDKQKEMDQFEKAHQGLFGQKTGTDKAAEAGRLTADFTAPGAPLSGDVPRKNYVDEYIFGRMERDGIPHAALAGDEEFVRRAYIDATGLLPTPDAVRQFVASKDPDKRDNLIDSLIGSEEFSEQWAWLWMDMFQSRNESFAFWLKQWLKLDRPYNEVFADIVGGGGVKSHLMVPTWGAYQQPIYNAARAPSPTDQDNYFLANRLDFIDEVSVNVGRIFLGINMDCISCHDGAGHNDSLNLFLAGKTRSDFHQQAAFFGRVRNVATWGDRVRNISVSNMIMDDSGPGYKTANDAPFYTAAEARFPRSGENYEAAFILTGEKPRPDANPRQELGRIAPAHIQFSRAAVNVVWSKLMVVGFVEPFDGFDLLRLDPNNPPPKPWTLQPTYPQLLDAMAKDFKEHNYSMHHLLKTIMKSSAYQLSTLFPGEWKDAYSPYYARRFVRVMTGPEVADILAQATGRPYEFEIMGQKATRVKQLASPTGLGARQTQRTAGAGNTAVSEGSSVSAIMQAFFQSTRETPTAITNRASAVQAMLMMSTPAVNNRVLAKSGSSVQQLLESGKTDSQVIEELFLRTLSRMPKPAETEVALRILEGDRKQGAEDIQWGLLNTAEFLLNH